MCATDFDEALRGFFSARGLPLSGIAEAASSVYQVGLEEEWGDAMMKARPLRDVKRSSNDTGFIYFEKLVLYHPCP